MTTNLIKTNQLVKIDQIKSEFVMYGVFKESANMFVDSDNKHILNSKYMYFYENQKRVLNENRINLQKILDFLDNSDLPDKFKPKLKIITDKALNRVKQKSRKHRINVLNKLKTPTYSQKDRLFDLKLLQKFVDDCIVYEISFKTSLISLLEQKQILDKRGFFDGFMYSLQKDILKFFKNYTKHTGKDFDEYIDEWAKQLLNGEKNENN